MRAIGVSNFRRSDLEALLSTAHVVPAINQVELNVLNLDDDTIAFSCVHNITIEAYSPLGHTGHSGNITANAAVHAAAAAHNVSAYQVALRWILQHGHVLTFQSSSQEHQQQDADLFSFALAAAEMAALDKQHSH